MNETKTINDTPTPAAKWVAGISDVDFEAAFAPGEIIQNVGHIRQSGNVFLLQGMRLQP
jgi:hypothetical protein